MKQVFYVLICLCLVSCGNIKVTDSEDGVNEILHLIASESYKYEIVVDCSGKYRGIIPKTETGKYILYEGDDDLYIIQNQLLSAFIADKCMSYGFSKNRIEDALSYVEDLPDTRKIPDEEMKEIISQCYSVLRREPIYEIEQNVNEKRYGCGECFKSFFSNEYTYTHNICVQRITKDFLERQIVVDYEIRKEFPSLSSKYIGAIFVTYYAGI